MMKVLGRKCGDEGNSISYNKVAKNFGIGVIGIEEICIKVAYNDQVLVDG